MTDRDIINAAVADPVVIQRHTKFVGGAPQPPSGTFLSGLAQTEMQVEINALMATPAIRKEVLERSESVSTSSTSSEGRGDILTMPSYVASVISITSTDTQLPLMKLGGREEFDYWYAERYNADTAPNTPEAWLPWDPSTDRYVRVLLTPSKGSASTVKVAYIRKVDQPVKLADLPDDVHWLVLIGLKNRLSGGQYEASYQQELTKIESRMDRAVGDPTPMPLDATMRRMNQRLSSMTSGEYPNAGNRGTERPW